MLSGSGEPTLHSRFGEIIKYARAASSIPVALLTNGSTLGIPEVRAAAAKADVVKISHSAGDEASFKYINRPHPDLVFEDVVAGLQAFHEIAQRLHSTCQTRKEPECFPALING